MKNKTLLFVFFITIVLSFSNSSFSQTQISPGDVSGTWTLTGSPYLINGEITIPNDSTLIIDPEVIVEFQGHYRLNVQGRLISEGTENDTIIFTINDTTGFSDPNIPDGGWYGIKFDNTSITNDSSKIAYCKLQYGKAIGSWPDNCGGAIRVDGYDKIVIYNCLIYHNIAAGTDWPGGGGIALSNSNAKIIGNTISHNITRFGGGIQCYESSPFIENNIIEYNTAEAGGGIVCNENSQPIITNTIIKNNTATNGDGGGIVSWSNSNLTFLNVSFLQNSARFNGGGISINNGDLHLDSCNFIENESLSGSGGAICYLNDTADVNLDFDISFTDCDFSSNLANFMGGGVRIIQFDDSTNTTVMIDRCQFNENIADYHTALKIRGNIDDLVISNSVFSENEATRFTAGLSFTRNVMGKVFNCLFESNIAACGGGNWNAGGVSVWSESSVDFMNCTFANNSAAYGAGLTVAAGGIATLTNCIFWYNYPDQVALDSMFNSGGTLNVNYCDIQDGIDSLKIIDPFSALIWGIGNIDTDPFFVNEGIRDYHLQNNSPCIGAGIDSIEIGSIWFCCPACDCEGNTRPNPPGSRPDIGAYENPLGSPSIIEQKKNLLPKKIELCQNYPNPFNPSTKIKYTLPKSEKVKIEVFNLLGQKIETLLNKKMSPGSHEVEFIAKDLPSGVYLYRIVLDSYGETGGFQEVRKMILMK